MLLKSNNYDEITFKNIKINIKNIELKEWLLSDFRTILKVIKTYEINELLEKIQDSFEYIILDFSRENDIENKEIFLKKANKIFFIMEANWLSINKSSQNLEEYINDYKIEKNQIKIILNKTNKYSINKKIIQENFYKLLIIDEILYDEHYTLFINSNFENIITLNNFEKIYKKI